MTKKLVHQKITILNVYAFNNRAPKQIKHKSIRLQEKNRQFHNCRQIF